jgi:hypothetical protein
MPQISIITPVYIDTADKIDWLIEMLQSVLEQTFSDWEVILIDDCSPLLLGAVKIHFGNEPRFRWLKASHNQGPAAIRNSAVALAESDCILPVDADDVLANADVLQRLYDAWQQDKTKIIYGNLQRLSNQGAYWQRGRIIQFPEYTFERVMDLNGLIPVTAMHSKHCHNAAGGWKTTLQFGLEDVEYWIAAGKSGHCGQHINAVVLAYRRHDTSRSYNLRFGNRNEDAMKRQIIDIHKDVFEGNFPMGCCGKGSTTSQAGQTLNMMSAAQSTPLEGFSEAELIWVEYAGKRAAGFQILGRTTRTDYRVQGPGHKMQVHRDDLQIFRSMGRGQDFRIGIPAPQAAPQITVIEQPAPASGGGDPEMAQLERLDEVAAKARGIETEAPQPAVVVETAPPVFEDMPRPNGQATGLSVLDLSENLVQLLEAESWTVEKLAEATPDELLGYKGIGPARSVQIVESAKQWLSQ